MSMFTGKRTRTRKPKLSTTKPAVLDTSIVTPTIEAPPSPPVELPLAAHADVEIMPVANDVANPTPEHVVITSEPPLPDEPPVDWNHPLNNEPIAMHIVDRSPIVDPIEQPVLAGTPPLADMPFPFAVPPVVEPVVEPVQTQGARITQPPTVAAIPPLTCPSCKGSGKFLKSIDDCYPCHGKGTMSPIDVLDREKRLRDAAKKIVWKVKLTRTEGDGTITSTERHWADGTDVFKLYKNGSTTAVRAVKPQRLNPGDRIVIAHMRDKYFLDATVQSILNTPAA